MISAIDSSVLFDIFLADPVFGPGSADALRRCLHEGQVIACPAVWAEVTSLFVDESAAVATLADVGVVFDGISRPAADAAGRAWRKYRERGGTRRRVVADFLIGAHAATEAQRLLTRDAGFFRDYFDGLEVLDPTSTA